jgi:hypothetical protein
MAFTFTVEDGTGLENANAYITEAFFRDHHDGRSRDVTFYSQEEVEGAVVKASDYVDQRFGRRFLGTRLINQQGLEWPRLSAFDNDGFLLNEPYDGVPRQLEKAVAEYTLIVLRLIGNELLPIPARPFATIDEDTGEISGGVSGQIVRNRERVGPLETEQWYSDRSRAGERAVGVKSSLVDDLNIPDYPRADLWLEELLHPSMSIRLGRGD